MWPHALTVVVWKIQQSLCWVLQIVTTERLFFPHLEVVNTGLSVVVFGQLDIDFGIKKNRHDNGTFNLKSTMLM